MTKYKPKSKPANSIPPRVLSQVPTLDFCPDFPQLWEYKLAV